MSLIQSPYDRHPDFARFLAATGLPFKPYEHFTRESIAERSELYRQIASIIWNPEDILNTLTA